MNLVKKCFHKADRNYLHAEKMERWKKIEDQVIEIFQDAIEKGVSYICFQCLPDNAKIIFFNPDHEHSNLEYVNLHNMVQIIFHAMLTSPKSDLLFQPEKNISGSICMSYLQKDYLILVENIPNLQIDDDRPGFNLSIHIREKII
ncbi:hypothetical protein GCM10010995_24140 [Cysteiniphilum litorale]|uniref:Uncharacterized protein n=2 Tax=Fastidiosibacteraceae TaxID=2056687 RepID=A0A8J2Z6N2_9GAMM|nr:hypothetical protein [Cysteiniphilum litorale]GGG05797.1 hypothetical protein GCM10010995_24140 [Cysteiniphilum litorale]